MSAELLPVPVEAAEPPVVEEPDEFEESRPVDLDECPRCDGQGMYVAYEGREAGYRFCSWCGGTGELAPGRGWVA